MTERPPREQLIRIATDRNAWPYQEQIEALLDAIEREIRERLAQQLYDQNPDRDADFTAGVDWAIDTIRNT